MAAADDVFDSEGVLAEELAVLESIYITELSVEKDQEGWPERISVLLHPATGMDESRKYVCMTLGFRLPRNYPEEAPKIDVKNPRGLGEEELQSLLEDMRKLAEERKGGQMLFELIEMAKDCLTEGNIPHCECAICLDHFDEGDNFIKTDCYHYFHRVCLVRYANAFVARLQEEEESPVPLHVSDGKKENVLGCPMCRLPLTCDLSELLAESVPEEKAEVFVPSPELIGQQGERAALYAAQKAKGGIIDLDHEKNKYLVDQNTVVSLGSLDINTEDNSKPSVSTSVSKTTTKPSKPTSRQTTDADRHRGKGRGSSHIKNQGKYSDSHRPSLNNPSRGSNGRKFQDTYDDYGQGYSDYEDDYTEDVQGGRHSEGSRYSVGSRNSNQRCYYNHRGSQGHQGRGRGDIQHHRNQQGFRENRGRGNRSGYRAKDRTVNDNCGKETPKSSDIDCDISRDTSAFVIEKSDHDSGKYSTDKADDGHNRPSPRESYSREFKRGGSRSIRHRHHDDRRPGSGYHHGDGSHRRPEDRNSPRDYPEARPHPRDATKDTTQDGHTDRDSQNKDSPRDMTDSTTDSRPYSTRHRGNRGHRRHSNSCDYPQSIAPPRDSAKDETHDSQESETKDSPRETSDSTTDSRSYSRRLGSSRGHNLQRNSNDKPNRTDEGRSEDVRGSENYAQHRRREVHRPGSQSHHQASDRPHHKDARQDAQDMDDSQTAPKSQHTHSRDFGRQDRTFHRGRGRNHNNRSLGRMHGESDLHADVDATSSSQNYRDQSKKKQGGTKTEKCADENGMGGRDDDQENNQGKKEDGRLHSAMHGRKEVSNTPSEGRNSDIKDPHHDRKPVSKPNRKQYDQKTHGDRNHDSAPSSKNGESASSKKSVPSSKTMFDKTEFSSQGAPPGFKNQGAPPGFNIQGTPPGFKEKGSRNSGCVDLAKSVDKMTPPPGFGFT